TGDGTMTFSGSTSAINAALGSGLTYDPTANYNGADTVTFSTTDGTGQGGTATDMIDITINAVNDAPSGTSTTVTGSDDDAYIFTVADFGFSDGVEGDDLLAVVIDEVPLAGELLLNGVAVLDGNAIAASDIAQGLLTFVPDPGTYGDGYASLTFRV